MQHKGTVLIETPRLTLRRIAMQDVEAAYRNWESDDATTRFLRWPTARDIATVETVTRSWVEGYADPSFYQWVIVPRELNEPIGTISVVDMNERTGTVHIGYCIGSRWWRMGYTSEAFAAIIPFLFEQVKVQRIEAQHDPENPGSGAVMRKCGLKYEGTLRKADWNNRGIVDAAMYSLLAEEYFDGKSAAEN